MYHGGCHSRALSTNFQTSSMLPAHSELCKGSRNAEAERCKLQRFDNSALPSLKPYKFSY